MKVCFLFFSFLDYRHPSCALRYRFSFSFRGLVGLNEMC